MNHENFTVSSLKRIQLSNYLRLSRLSAVSSKSKVQTHWAKHRATHQERLHRPLSIETLTCMRTSKRPSEKGRENDSTTRAKIVVDVQ